MDYDLAHMWTGRPDADGAGIAWIGPVCRNRRFGYGISKHYRNAPVWLHTSSRRTKSDTTSVLTIPMRRTTDQGL